MYDIYLTYFKKKKIIRNVHTTPLLLRNKVPYHWSHGVTYGAEVILVEVQTEEGVSGYGETIGTPRAAGV